MFRDLSTQVLKILFETQNNYFEIKWCQNSFEFFRLPFPWRIRFCGCNSVDVHQCFGRMYRFHFRGWRISQAANCNKKAASGARYFYRTTRRYNPEVRICHRCENLKSNNSFHVRDIALEDPTQTTDGVARTETVANGMFQAMMTSCNLCVDAPSHELFQRFRMKNAPLFSKPHCSPTERTLWLNGWHSKSPYLVYFIEKQLSRHVFCSLIMRSLK